MDTSEKPGKSNARELARRVLRIEAEAVAALADRLDESFDHAVELLLGCSGRVVLTGMGKSGLVARKIAATLSSTGTPAFFLHPAEAVHGDLGMLVAGDTVIALSNSGTTAELIELLDWIKRLGITLITLTGERNSPLAQASDAVLDIGIEQEACPLGLAPSASTTAAMAMGDALALALIEARGFDEHDFARLHPAGRLGRRLRRIEDVMHTGASIPAVGLATPMADVIYEMSRKGLGVTAVLDEAGNLAGIISDGDLRRLLQRRNKEILDAAAGECMTHHPVTIGRTALAAAALQLMESRKITSLLVVDPAGKLEGIVHLHDLWSTGMV